MQNIRISDVTMKQVAEGFSLSFKEKIELSKILDKLGVDVIEIEGIKNERTDALRIKSIAASVQDSVVAVPVELNEESVRATWNALKLAHRPRLQVCAPTSSVQMEYLFHKKPDAMILSVEETIRLCSSLCKDVEFVAEDATRADPEFLAKILSVAAEAGATIVTICDSAGTMLPHEFAAFLKNLSVSVPRGVKEVNTLSLADASIIAAIGEGVEEVKVAAYPLDASNLSNVVRILATKGDDMGVSCGVSITTLSRTMEQIARICQAGKASISAASSETEDIFLTAHDDITALLTAAGQLGYDLSEEDGKAVYAAFLRIAEKKEKVSVRELDAIIASAAMQVPSTYQLDTYLISAGNAISATAHMKLLKNGAPMEGVSLGDGPIDAAFQAIEKITGQHYELDDFQIQAVTEGREAMAQTIVKLRSFGKVYSGRGISTDIVGSGILAYISALNKIVYEEEEA